MAFFATMQAIMVAEPILKLFIYTLSEVFHARMYSAELTHKLYLIGT